MSLWEENTDQRELYSAVGYHFLTVIIVPLVLFFASPQLPEKTQAVSLCLNPKNNNIIITKTFHSG